MRRRLLSSSKPKLPSNGAYILGTDNGFYTLETWDQPNDNVVGIAIIDDRAKFVSNVDWDPYGGSVMEKLPVIPEYLESIPDGILATRDENLAKQDYNGSRNTEIFYNFFGKGDYQISRCYNYIFKNGQRGYLGSLGETLVWQKYFPEIEAIHTKLFGLFRDSGWDWTSTCGSTTTFWQMQRSTGVCYADLSIGHEECFIFSKLPDIYG